MKRFLLMGFFAGFVTPAMAITPAPWGVISQAAKAIDVTCPTEGATVPNCYVRVIFYENAAYPITICYTVPNKSASTISSPLALSLLLPNGNMQSNYLFTVRGGLQSCP